MSVFALSDWHLGNQVDKPMHKFGAQWEQHAEKIALQVRRHLKSEDLLLIPGDISWALRLTEAEEDLGLIDSLPGRKVLLRGNHDYWWTTLRKNDLFAESKGWQSLHFLQNTAHRFEDGQLGGVVIAGTRGWIFPDDPKWQGSDERILAREIGRLRGSLAEADRLRQPGDLLICMMHYPPFTRMREATEFTELMARAKVDLCVYGHIHKADSPQKVFGWQVQNIPMYLTSCDQIDFTPLKLDDLLTGSADGSLNK